MLSQLPLPSFVNLVPRALNHELFSRSILGDSSSQTAMVAQRSSSNRFKSASPFLASGQSAKPFSATCQWCGKERHTAKKCHKLVGTDYVIFTETCDNSLRGDNSFPIGGTPVCNQTPTHCVPCAGSTPIIIPPLTHSQPFLHEIALEVLPFVPSTTIQLSTSTHPMVTRA
ncbi:hypothetical protein DKX38_019591 [Salix brachista]|uniref:Uncharacterized protein n=1 Tax=Salix brachista TaxID=2182728 RepID=A0A5N5KGP1_9ROSI|nr:hypothetical protein DKX38_019591 [Salix brachista]